MGGHSKNMDTYGIYGHEMQGDTDLTAQMIQDRFTDLLSNSKNKVNFENSQKENPNKPHDLAPSWGFKLGGGERNWTPDR